MYGDEETGTPPDQLYSLIDAEDVLKSAKKVLGMCLRLMKEYGRE